MQTNWFDIVSAALILLIGIKGIFNGIVRELAGLLGLVTGIWAGSLYATDLGRWLGSHLIALDSPSALAMIGFLTILATTWVLFIILGVILEKSLAIPELGVGDRIGGFLIASLKVFIILAVIVYALSTIEFVQKNAQRFVEKSLFYPWYIKTGETIFHIRPSQGSARNHAIENEANTFIRDSEKALDEQNGTRGSR